MCLAAVENSDRDAAVVRSRTAKGGGFAMTLNIQSIDGDALQAEGFTHHLGTEPGITLIDLSITIDAGITVHNKITTNSQQGLRQKV